MRTVAFWFSLILIFVIPLENVALVPGLGRISRIAGLLAAALWVIMVIMTRKMSKPRPVHVAIVLFVLWNALSVLWSIDVDESFERFMTYMQLFGMVLIITDLYASPKALHAGLQAYVLGAYFGIASTIYSYFNASEFYYQRYSGAGLHVNDLGLILALGIPVAWYLTLVENNEEKSAWRKLINYIYIPAAVLAIILTGSRSALLAAVPGFFYVLWSLSRFKPYLRVLLLGALMASLFAVQFMIPQTSLQRLAETGTEITEGDWNGRLGIWREGLALFVKHPFFGVGAGAFRSAAVEAGKLAHNFAISLLAEVGIIGFALFGIILAMAVCLAIGQPQWQRRLWLAVLTAWFIGAVSHNWEHRKQTWLFLSLVIAGATLSTQQILPSTKRKNDINNFASKNGLQRKGNRNKKEFVDLRFY